MADKITSGRRTSREVFSFAWKEFSGRYGGKTCMGLEVCGVAVAALWDHFSGSGVPIIPTLLKGTTIAVVVWCVGFLVHLAIAPFKMLEHAQETISVIEGKRVKLKLAIGEPDFHRNQKAFYLQGTVSNEGGDTARGVKAKLLDFPDYETTLNKNFDLAWSQTRPGAIDLRGGEKEVFDIGVMGSVGYPPTLEMLLYAGDKRIKEKYRHTGTYPMEVQILADGMEPITEKIDVTVAQGGERGNKLLVSIRSAA